MQEGRVGGLTVAQACQHLAGVYARAASSGVDVEGLAQRLTSAAKVVLESIGEGEVEPGVVASAIWFVAEMPRREATEVLLAQFPATLRTLLGLLVSEPLRCEESGAFIAALSAAAVDCERRFVEEAPARERERVLAREAEERKEAEKMAAMIESAAASTRTDAPPAGPAAAVVDGGLNSGVPPAWRPSKGNPGEWFDTARGEATKAARKHAAMGYPHFVLSGRAPNVRVQCILRWGHDELAVELRSGWKITDGEAFEEAMRLSGMCPDEPIFNWQTELAKQVPVGQRPARVTMRNVVPCGVPRYVCTATWNEPARDQRSSLQMTTMREAAADLVERIKERAARIDRPRKMSVAEQLTHSGLLKATVVFRPVGRQYVAVLSWRDLDDAKRTCESTAKAEQHEAVVDAIDKARGLDEERSLDWMTAAKRLLVGGAAPAGVYFEEAQGEGGVCCLLRWQEQQTRIVKGPPRKTRRQALIAVAAVEVEQRKTRREAANALQAGASQSQGRQQIIHVLQQRRPEWTSERARLVAMASRTPEQDMRLRDLTTLLAVVDPVRRSEVDPMVASRLVEDVLRETARSGPATTWLPPETRQAAYLRAMCEGVPTAGASMRRTAEFEAACQADCVAEDKALQALVTLRLLNRKEDGRMTLSQQGEKVVMRQPGSRAGAFGAKFKAALQK